MQKEIKHHPKARAESIQSARYYDLQRTGLGAEFYDELDGAMHRLLSDPLRPSADSDGVRSWRLNRFPFRVYYVVDSHRIRILAVAHLKRRLGYWRERIEE